MTTIIKNIGQLPSVEKARYAILSRATQKIRGEAVTNAPYETGTLRRSILSEVTPTYGKVGSNLPYARFREFGGTIVPKKAKMLAWKRGWKWHFAKKVTQKWKPYLIPAFEKVKSDMGDIIDGELTKTTL